MPDYRLDELSALSGVSIRNIRAYRERGLLDPPRRQGRSAYYDDRHLSQLSTINELLRKGFTSAHIAEFLSSTRAGHDLADILGLQQAIFGPSRGATASVVDIDADGDEAKRLLHYGLARVVDGRLALINPDVAEIVQGAGDQLRYVQAILRVADDITGLLDELARSVAEAVEQSVFAVFGDQVPDGADPSELRQVADDFRVLGRHVVADHFEDALRRYHLTAAPVYSADVAVRGNWHPEER